MSDSCFIGIIHFFPRTQEHLEVRHNELIEQLKEVQESGKNFSERLAEAQNNRDYFQVNTLELYIA